MSRFAPALGSGVSRRDIALSPGIWLIVGLTFGLFAIALAIIPAVLPGLEVARVHGVGILLGVCSLVLLRMHPPEPGAPATHAVLVLVYACPAAAVWAFSPDGALVLGAAVFIGPLTAVWIVERRQMIAHLAAAGVTLFVPVALGEAGTSTIAGLIWIVPSIWALAICCALTLAAAEYQGEQLTALVKRDPLTGIGNRRLLDEQLDLELTRSRANQRPLTVLTLDLNGFKALNDTLGHAAGDELLKAAAKQLSASARRNDTVVRQGGDEFCLILPETSREEAEVVAGMIRSRFREVKNFGQGITTGIGLAAFPEDGDFPAALLDTADARLRVDKADRPARTSTLSVADLPSLSGPVDTPADPVANEPFSPFLDGLTRLELSQSRMLWRATAAMFLFYPTLGLLMWGLAPSFHTEAFLPVGLGGLALGIVYLVVKPPPAGSIRNHLVVVTVYLFPALSLAATKPAGAATIGLAIWIGPVVAVRLTSRWHAAAHYAAASTLMTALVVFGLVQPAVTIALLVMVGTIWVLGACCILVLETAEAQGIELARLVRRDPLTGAGNRRQLHERMAIELAHHRMAGAQLTVLALDLNGFKNLNDTVGHAAGDELLCTVARELASIVDGQGDVVRQGGDEFAVLLPWCTAAEAEGVMAAIRTRLGEIVIAGVPVSTGVGAATFPTDGVDIDGLLDRADNRLRTDKYGADAGAVPRAARVDGQGNGRTMAMDSDVGWMAKQFGRLT